MLEVGIRGKTPYYIIVGIATNFYVWAETPEHKDSCGWICGRDAFKLYNRITNIKSKQKFLNEVGKAWQERKEQV